MNRLTNMNHENFIQRCARAAAVKVIRIFGISLLRTLFFPRPYLSRPPNARGMVGLESPLKFCDVTTRSFKRRGGAAVKH